MSGAIVRRSLVRGLVGALLVVLGAWSSVPEDPVELHVIGRHSAPATAGVQTAP